MTDKEDTLKTGQGLYKLIVYYRRAEGGFKIRYDRDTDLKDLTELWKHITLKVLSEKDTSICIPDMKKWLRDNLEDIITNYEKRIKP